MTLNGNSPGRFHYTKAIATQTSAQTSRNINNFPFYFRSDVSVVEHTRLAHLIYSTIQFSFPLKSPQSNVDFKDSRIKLIHTSKKQIRVLLSHMRWTRKGQMLLNQLNVNYEAK